MTQEERSELKKKLEKAREDLEFWTEQYDKGLISASERISKIGWLQNHISVLENRISGEFEKNYNKSGLNRV